MQFISSEIIINNVKAMLSSYSEAGLLNEDDFYVNIKWMLNKLGLGVYVEAETILEIENYKASLPEDFYMLWAIHRLDYKGNNCIEREFYYKPQIYYVRDELKNICYNDSRCEKDTTITGVEYKREISFKSEQCTQHYHNRRPLKLKKSLLKCYENSINYKIDSDEEFTINPHSFNFNFKEGLVHLEYYALPKDEEGFLVILDDEYVKQAIQDYLIYKIFQNLYYNNNGDVLQRMQYSEQKHKESLRDVQNHLQTPSFKDLVDFGKNLADNLEIFNLQPTNYNSDKWKYHKKV